MLILKLILLCISSALFWWGGHSFLTARRFIMPTLLAISCLLFSHCFWALTMFSVIGIFVLGYGPKSEFWHIFGDGWGRGIWGLLSGLCLSVWAPVTHHLVVPHIFLLGHLPAWVWFAGYNGVNFTLENALKDIPQDVGDPAIGIGFASILFLV